jgi:lipopolysaccharide export system permease protein
MIIFSRYLGAGIYKATFFVLLCFLSMFLFLDFLDELDQIGRDGASFASITVYLALGLPNKVYELAPIAALIGALWALSQSAVNSEFTVFRVSGLRPRTAIMTMLLIGLPMIIVTSLFSEVVVPYSEEQRVKVRSGALGSAASGQMRSGFWMRDTAGNAGEATDMSADTASGAAAGSASAAPAGMRFINAARLRPDRVLERIEIYEFDPAQRLTTIISAKTAHYQGMTDRHQWELQGVKQTHFGAGGAVRSSESASLLINSLLSPDTLGALVTNPDRMSARELYYYIDYLKLNKQVYERYEVAFWKRVLYPFAIWVMLLLALPTAYLQARQGAVSTRVFAGILVGVGFHLVNSLFSHLGVLTALSPMVMSAVPSMLALLVAAAALYWVQRR